MVSAHLDTLTVPAGLNTNHSYKVRLEAGAYDQQSGAGIGPYANDVVEVDGDCLNADYTHCQASNQLDLDASGLSGSPSTGDQLSVLRPGSSRVLPTAPYTTASDGVYTQHLSTTSNNIVAADIGNGVTSPERVVVASIPLTSIHANDLIDVVDAEVTADDHPGDGYAFEHYVETSLVLATGATVGSGTGVLYNLSPWAGGNCNARSPENHCGDPTSPSIFHTSGIGPILGNQSGPLYVNLVARAEDQNAPNGAQVDFGPGSIDLLCSSADKSTLNPGCS